MQSFQKIDFRVVFNDEAVLTDLFGGIGVELIKAGIATAHGYAAGLAAGAFFSAAALPVVVGAIIVFAVGIGLNELDNRYNIKSSVKSGMRYAADNVAELHETLTKISAKDLRVYTEDLATGILQSLMDKAVDETKSWVLKKSNPANFPFLTGQKPLNYLTFQASSSLNFRHHELQFGKLNVTHSIQTKRDHIRFIHGNGWCILSLLDLGTRTTSVRPHLQKRSCSGNFLLGILLTHGSTSRATHNNRRCDSYMDGKKI
ncbi:hypothetical protein JTA33_26160 [Pseudomonas sp. 20GA0080]|nr:hypothetical protein [Pseudomonas alliivorans]